MQNPGPGVGFINDIIPEVLAQLLVNPLGLAICLGIVRR